MKKLLLGVITFALIITSCNKYADDFQQLKDSIAALDTKVAGVIQLQTDLTSVKATLASLTTAVAALPSATTVSGQFATLAASLGLVDGKITTLTTTLASVATTGTANATAIAAVTTSLNGIIAAKTAADLALNTKLDLLKTDLKTAIDAGNAASDGKIAAAQTAILAQIAASAITVNANVDAKILAATTALQAAITTAATATNNNVNAQIAAAQSALLAAITAAQVDLNAKLAAGLVNVGTQVTAAQTALQTAITTASAATDGNVNTKIAALTTALNSMITAGNAATMAQILATQAALMGDPTSTDATALTIKGLQLALAAAKAEIDIILVNTSMYNGDVYITNNAEYDFFLAKINQLGIINGSLFVNPTTILDPVKKADINTILKRIQAVIGTGNVTITNTTEALNFDLLASVKGNVTIVSGTANTISLPKLATVSGPVGYSVTGADVVDTALSAVVGSVTLNYGGDYASTSLTAVGGDLVLVNKTAAPKTGNINFPNVAVAGKVGDVLGIATGVVTFNNVETASINLAGGVTTLTANNAVTLIRLGSATYPSALTINSTLGKNIDLSACTAVTGGITLATPAATLIDLSKLGSTTTVGVTMTGAGAAVVKMDLFNSNIPVSITGPLTVSLPSWVANNVAATFNAPQATTVTLAKNVWTAVPTTANLNAVQTLTLGDVDDVVLLNAYPTLKVANVTGKTTNKWFDVVQICKAGVVSTGGNANLTTLVLGGVMNSVWIDGAASPANLLMNVTTSGSINSFTMDNVPNITAVTLGHQHFQGIIGFGAPGSDLRITGNPKLTALAPTALNKMKSLSVMNNQALASFDFSSYQDVILTGSVSIVISNNKSVLGTYVPGYDVFGTTPASQAIIKSNSLLTLQGYMNKIAASPLTVPFTSVVPGALFNIDINVGTVAIPSWLSTVMPANATSFTLPAANKVDNILGITNMGEMNLVVAQ